MGDNKHGEPWEVGHDTEIWAPHVIGEMKYPEKANRAVLCVNACAGLSDEEVENLPSFGEVMVKTSEAILAESDALKADLEEARELLRRAIGDDGPQRVDVLIFLKRTGGK